MPQNMAHWTWLSLNPWSVSSSIMYSWCPSVRWGRIGVNPDGQAAPCMGAVHGSVHGMMHGCMVWWFSGIPLHCSHPRHIISTSPHHAPMHHTMRCPCTEPMYGAACPSGFNPIPPHLTEGHQLYMILLLVLLNFESLLRGNNYTCISLSTWFPLKCI